MTDNSIQKKSGNIRFIKVLVVSQFEYILFNAYSVKQIRFVHLLMAKIKRAIDINQRAQSIVDIAIDSKKTFSDS